MSAWGWCMFSVVALWLAPGSLWRPIALALLAQWAVSEAIYQYNGDRLPLEAYIIGDLAVIACAIFWRSHWSDWIIVAPYPMVWWLYGEPVTRDSWIALYFIALAQMVIAGPWPQLQKITGRISHGSVKLSRARGV